MQNNQECPICGCKEIGKGRQAAQGSMIPVGSIWTGSAILSDICTDCGYILSMRVEKPEKFRINR